MAVAAAESLQYVAIDDLPEVGSGRQAVREQAWQLLESRRQLLETGHHEALPLQIDALSTAYKVLEAEELYGTSSPQHQESRAGLRLDCSRLIGEWFRKNRPEYFFPIRHVHQPGSDDFYSHGLSLRQLTENALTPHAGNAEEEMRRVNERVEEATPQLLRKAGSLALEGAKIRTISECTDKAIQDYRHDMATGAAHRGYGGYVPEIEKVMIRDIVLDEETNDRFEEQVGLPGIYITHDIIKEAIQLRGINAENKDKTALHGTQLLVRDDLIEFVEHLDSVASEQWCTNIFMGEEVDANHPKDYDNIRTEALERQKLLASHAEMVTDFVLELARDNTDGRKAPAIIEEFVKKILMNMARADNQLAAEIFDDKTAHGLREVLHLESIGKINEAMQLFQKVEQQAPGGGFCGAGSCGLEAVFGGSKDAEEVKKLGFNNTDKVIKDTVRKCKCGAKTVFYDLIQTKKGCTTCGKTTKY